MTDTAHHHTDRSTAELIRDLRANPGTTAAVLAAVLVAVLVLRRLFKR